MSELLRETTALIAGCRLLSFEGAKIRNRFWELERESSYFQGFDYKLS